MRLLVPQFALMMSSPPKLGQFAPEKPAGDRAYIEACTVRVVSTERLHVVPNDEDDNRLLECAAAREWECVVTGAGVLLRIGSYVGIRILTVGEFLERLKEAD